MAIRIYIIGFILCFLFSLLIEHFYYGNGRGETVSFQALKENFLFSFLSWIGILGEIFFLITEWVTGFDNRGYGAFLHDYEEELKEEDTETKNAAEK